MIGSIPIRQKSCLQAINCFTFQLYMGISPIAPRNPFHISHGNIHTSDKAYFPVHNGYFPMVSVIYLTRKSRETNLQERTDINAHAQHFIIKLVRNIPTAYIIIKHPHFYSLTRLICQSISNQPPYRVILKDIRLQMNMVLCA